MPRTGEERALSVKLSAILVCVVLVAYAANARAVEYNVGVSEGQWVKYGNFATYGTCTPDAAVPMDLNNTDWIKIEAVTVAGKNVTLHVSGKFANGTDAREKGVMYNIENGMANDTYAYIYMPVIAAGLDEGDALPRYRKGAPSPYVLHVNKTENRIYSATSRSVNIVIVKEDIPGHYETEYIFVFDKASGILLEMSISLILIQPFSCASRMSFSISETNMFTPGLLDWLIVNIAYVLMIVIVISLVLVIAGLRLRKKARAFSSVEPSN